MQQDALTVRKRDSYQIFNDIAPTYDFLNHVLSLGIDRYWRKKLASRVPLGQIQVLDLATGTGDLALTVAHWRPEATITALDLSQGMIDIGKRKVEQKNLTHRVKMAIGDGVNLSIPDRSVDIISIGFGIRNFSGPYDSLKQCARALRPGGKILILEFSWPPNRLVRSIYNFYFRYLLPWIGNRLSRHKDAYTYLNQTVENFPFGEAFLQLMRDAGFQTVSATPLTFGIATLYQGTAKNE